MKYWIVSFIVFLLFFQNASYFEGTKYIPILVMLGYLTLYKVGEFNVSKTISDNKILILYVVLVCIGLLRNNAPFIPGSTAFLYVIQLVLFVLFLFKSFYIFKNSSKSDYDILFYYIFWPVFLFVGLNFILYYLDIQFHASALGEDSATMKAVTLGYLGFDIYRVEFPLADGLNGFSVYIGAALILGLMAFLVKLNRSVLLIIICVAFLIALLLIDSRASYLYPVIICFALLYWYRKRNLSKKIAIISFVTIIGPFLYMFLLPTLFANSTWMSRGEGDLASGNERFMIWGISLLYFSSFNPIDLIGFGHYGHYGSRVSLQWGLIFKNWTNSSMHTPHNTMFSIIFDYGYIGLFVYVFLFYQLFRRIAVISQYNRKSALIFMSFLIYCIAQGISEAVEGYYSANFLYVFITVCFFINQVYSIYLDNNKLVLK